MTEVPKDAAVGFKEALGAEGGNPSTLRRNGYTIHWTARDRQVLVSSCENGIKGQFEEWVQSNARLGIRRIRSDVEAAGYRDAYNAAFGAGSYTWTGKHCRAARGDQPGVTHLLYLLVRRCQEDFTEEDALALYEDETEQVYDAVGWALGNSRATADSKAVKKTPVTMDGSEGSA